MPPVRLDLAAKFGDEEDPEGSWGQREQPNPKDLWMWKFPFWLHPTELFIPA